MQEDNLTLENRTRTNEVAEWVITNLEQDRIYSEITKLEQEIEDQESELSLITPKSNDAVRERVYHNLGSMLDEFKNNSNDNLSDKEGASDYITEMSDKPIPEKICTLKLKGYEVKNAIKSKPRCDTVRNLLDAIEEYNKYVANLNEKNKLDMNVRVNKACHYARLLVKDDDHEPIGYFPHLFDKILNTGRGNPSKLSDEQVEFAVGYFEVKGRTYQKKVSRPFVSEPPEKPEKYKGVRTVEMVAMPSRSRDKNHNISKTTDNRTGEVTIGKCPCEKAVYRKDSDCHHRKQAKHKAGVPQAVQMDFDL